MNADYENAIKRPVDPAGTIAYKGAPGFDEWAKQSEMEFDIARLPYNPVDNPEMLLWARIRSKAERLMYVNQQVN